MNTPNENADFIMPALAGINWILRYLCVLSKKYQVLQAQSQVAFELLDEIYTCGALENHFITNHSKNKQSFICGIRYFLDSV